MTFTVMWIVWKLWDGRLVFGDCGRRVKFLGRLDFEKMTGSAFLFFLFLFHFYLLVNSLFPKVAPGDHVVFLQTKNNDDPHYSPHDDAPTTAPIAFIL